MAFPEFGSREDFVECVYPQVAGKHLFRLFQSEPHLVDRVFLDGVALCLSITERGILESVYFRNDNVLSFLEVINMGSVALDAKIIFQQGDNSVNSTFVTSAAYLQCLILRPEAESIFRQAGDVAFPNQDVSFLALCRFKDRQGSSADSLDEIL